MRCATVALPLLVGWTLGTAAARAETEDAEPDVLPGAEELPDYSPVRAWNGMGRFVELAQSLGLRVELVRADRVALDPTQNLVLVFPDTAPDGVALRAFVDAGGRLLVADDYGFGSSALAPLGMLRVDGPTAPSIAFRGDPALPIAVPTMRHPALEGVGAVVTNHPAALGPGPGAHCLLAFYAPPPACLLAETELGFGTALALADPSVLIDLMLQVDGNRRLAEGLLRYLTTNRRAVLTLALPADAFALAQPPDREGTGLRAAVRRWLARLSEPLAAAPPWFWLIVGLVLLVVAAVSRIRAPSREDYARPRLLHALRPGPSTAYPTPATPELWRAFAQEALDLMHETVARRHDDVSSRLDAARKAGTGLRRVLRLRLERARWASLQRRVRAAGDDLSALPSFDRLRRLAEEFVRDER
jgi:hypothetical protein